MDLTMMRVCFLSTAILLGLPLASGCGQDCQELIDECRAACAEFDDEHNMRSGCLAGCDSSHQECLAEE